MKPTFEICKLWPINGHGLRHYNAWFGRCSECCRKIVVPGAIKKKIATDPELKTICEQCGDLKTASGYENRD